MPESSKRVSMLWLWPLAFVLFASTTASAAPPPPADEAGVSVQSGNAERVAPPAESAPQVEAQQQEGEEVAASQCLATNRSLYVGAIAIDAGILVAFFLVFWIFVRKAWLARIPAAQRFFALLLFFSGFAAFGVGSFVYQPEVVRACLGNADLRSLMAFVEFTAWQRGLILGTAPVLVAGTLLKLLHAAISHR